MNEKGPSSRTEQDNTASKYRQLPTREEKRLTVGWQSSKSLNAARREESASCGCWKSAGANSTLTEQCFRSSCCGYPTYAAVLSLCFLILIQGTYLLIASKAVATFDQDECDSQSSADLAYQYLLASIVTMASSIPLAMILSAHVSEFGHGLTAIAILLDLIVLSMLFFGFYVYNQTQDCDFSIITGSVIVWGIHAVFLMVVINWWGICRRLAVVVKGTGLRSPRYTQHPRSPHHRLHNHNRNNDNRNHDNSDHKNSDHKNSNSNTSKKSHHPVQKAHHQHQHQHQQATPRAAANARRTVAKPGF